MSEITTVKKTKSFIWGKVVKIHTIKDIDVIEYKDENGETFFYPYVYEEPLCEHFSNIYESLLYAISVWKEGHQTKAGEYICRILGIKSSI